MYGKENIASNTGSSDEVFNAKTWSAPSTKATYPALPVFQPPLTARSLNGADHATSATDCYAALVQGAWFEKVGRHGKPHSTFIHVSRELTRIAWTRKSDPKVFSTIPCSLVERVIAGSGEGNFKRFKGLPSSRCFSIITANRTLDLQAQSDKIAQQWVESLKKLVETMKKAESGVPFNVEHVTHVDGDYQWSGAQNLPSMFRLVEKLGEGSFGEVYHGVHRDGLLSLAVKILTIKTKEQTEDLRAEINILKQLRHPNIVAYYGCYGPDEQKRTWLLMDYCAGGSISNLLDFISQPLSENQIAYICASILHALIYLHGKKIVHGDVKGSNLLLSGAGEVKLGDFGVSKQKHETSVNSRNMGDVVICGSPLWMAPEILRFQESTEKADIWALGITCFELAQRFPPYSNMQPAQAVRLIMSQPAATLNGKWSDNFRHFVAQCLTRNTEDRPSADSLLAHPFVKQFAEKSSLHDSSIQPLVKAMLDELSKLGKTKTSVFSRMLHLGTRRTDVTTHNGNRSCDFTHTPVASALSPAARRAQHRSSDSEVTPQQPQPHHADSDSDDDTLDNLNAALAFHTTTIPEDSTCDTASVHRKLSAAGNESIIAGDESVTVGDLEGTPHKRRGSQPSQCGDSPGSVIAQYSCTDYTSNTREDSVRIYSTTFTSRNTRKLPSKSFSVAESETSVLVRDDGTYGTGELPEEDSEEEAALPAAVEETTAQSGLPPSPSSIHMVEEIVVEPEVANHPAFARNAALLRSHKKLEIGSSNTMLSVPEAVAAPGNAVHDSSTGNQTTKPTPNIDCTATTIDTTSQVKPSGSQPTGASPNIKIILLALMVVALFLLWKLKFTSAVSKPRR